MAGHFVEDLDLIDDSGSTKPLTMIVPAFNEEVTIVDSVTNLIHCDYPRFEVVVVNDGSSDATLERLKQAFKLRRTDLPYREAIGTARVKALYEARGPLPKGVLRLIVIDKESAGKADALNVGVNASTAPYFVCLDADSILDQRALKEMMRVIQEDPRVVAVGGQVAIANGCTIRNGRVVSVGLPRHPLARFQMVEYLRSFTTGRTGLDRLDSILILSGVFAVFEKETVIRAGGYLTPFVRHRIVREYVDGGGRHRVRGHGNRGAPPSVHPRQAPRPPHRVPAPPRGLDRGAGIARVPAQAAGAVVPRAPRVALLPPGDAPPAPVRPDRILRAAGLLVLRVLRPDDRDRGVLLLLVPAAAAVGCSTST